MAITQLLAGRDVGVFPVLTIPPALIASLWFALSSRLAALLRLATLAIGTGLLLALL